MFNQNQTIYLVEELVSFHSTAQKIDELHKCAAFIERFFSDSGLTIKMYMEEDVPSLVITKGTKTPKIFLCGHFDVVDGDGDQFKPYRDKDRIYGRGSFDMKGAVAVLMSIMKDVSNTNHDVGLMLTGDEEIGGFNGVKFLLTQGYRSDVVILPDGGSKPENIINKEKGFLRIRLSSLGAAAHSSRPWLGKNAFDSLLSALQNIKNLFTPLSEHPKDNWIHTLNIGRIGGGTGYSQLAPTALAELDIRYIENVNAQEFVKEIAAQAGEEVKVELVLQGNMTHLDTQHELVKRYIETIQEIGLEPSFSFAHGSSDSRHFNEYNIPVIMSQPEGGNHHGRDEWVSVSSLEKYYYLIKHYLEKVK